MKNLKNTKICIFAKFPGIPEGIWSFPNLEKTKFPGFPRNGGPGTNSSHFTIIHTKEK